MKESDCFNLGAIGWFFVDLLKEKYCKNDFDIKSDEWEKTYYLHKKIISKRGIYQSDQFYFSKDFVKYFLQNDVFFECLIKALLELCKDYKKVCRENSEMHNKICQLTRANENNDC